MESDHESHSPSSSSSSSPCSSESFHRPALPSRSSWIRSEEIKEKCAKFLSKIGGKAKRRTNKTSEFRYDPMSYDLNFEDEFPINSFSARLPPSPQLKIRSEERFSASASREISACS